MTKRLQTYCKSDANRTVVWTTSPVSLLSSWCPSAEALIALRIVAANERWTTAWGQDGTQQRTMQRTRTTARRAARHPAPPFRAPLVRNGKPTADHPWK